MEAVNEELVAKLESEIRMEKDMRDSESYSETVKDYLENSPFKVSTVYLSRSSNVLTSPTRSKTHLARKKSS